MTDHLTAEDAARLLEGTPTTGPWHVHFSEGRCYIHASNSPSPSRAHVYFKNDAALMVAAPALAAALADSVPRADYEGEIEGSRAIWRAKSEVIRNTEAERDDASAEVSRLREALEVVRGELTNWKWDCVNEALTTIDAALAEGSDVLPTQRDH